MHQSQAERSFGLVPVANSICGGNSRFALNFVTFWYQRISSTPNTSQSPWTIGSISFMFNGHCHPPVLVGRNIREGTSFKISNQFMMPFTNTLMKYEIDKKNWKNYLGCPLPILWWNMIFLISLRCPLQMLWWNMKWIKQTNKSKIPFTNALMKCEINKK